VVIEKFPTPVFEVGFSPTTGIFWNVNIHKIHVGFAHALAIDMALMLPFVNAVSDYHLVCAGKI